MAGSGGRVTLHPSYTLWWAIILPGAFLTDLFSAPYQWTAGFLLVGLVVEGAALYRQWRYGKTGGTASEHFWALQKDRPALLLPVAGWSVWVVWQVLELVPAGRPIVSLATVDVGLVAVAVSVLGWLLIHFGFKGQYG